MTNIQTNACGYCGGFHTGTCPHVKRITYHGNGTIESVEFHDPNDVLRDPQGFPFGPIASGTVCPNCGTWFSGAHACPASLRDLSPLGGGPAPE